MAKQINLDIVAQSHLSDALMEIGFNPSLAQTRIRFVKFLIGKTDGNLNTKEDVDALWEEFKRREG